mgnify:CR=1 FL=1
MNSEYEVDSVQINFNHNIGKSMHKAMQYLMFEKAYLYHPNYALSSEEKEFYSNTHEELWNRRNEASLSENEFLDHSLSLINQMITQEKYDIDYGVMVKNTKNEIALYHFEKIEQLPWQKHNIDIVLDCTGTFGSKADGLAHIKQGAKKVLFSHPCTQDIDATIIYGINHQKLKADDVVVSNGSCTTNCIVPVIKVLDDAFGVESGTITTIHASMHDQQVIDAYHPDLRRSRAASQSIIPVDTKLAIGIERILPKFKGRFEAIAVRVPTLNVTAMDLSITVNKDVTIKEINQIIDNAQSSPIQENGLHGILSYTEEHLVSADFNHDTHSCIVDGNQTRVSHKRLVKMLVWSDNEWGFANRMLDTAQKMGELGTKRTKMKIMC